MQPFRPVTSDFKLDTASRAIQQNLLADLARASIRAAPADAAPGGRYTVTGTVQSVDGRLRLSGQIIDAATNVAVGGLSATGDGRDLFALEDALSAQLVGRLRRLTPDGSARPPVPPALQPAAAAAAITPPAAGVGAQYEGSALQSYVNANRTPSNDYTQQVIDARDRSTFGSYTSFANTAGFGYGGFGDGGFGYGGYGTGGYLLGVSYPVGSVGTFGIGGYGYNGFGGGYGRGVGGAFGGGFGGGFGRGGFRGSAGFGGGGFGGSGFGGRGGFR